MIAAATVCALSVASCDEPEERIVTEEPVPEIPSDKKVPEGGSFNVTEGTTVTILFETSEAWTAEADVEWISLSAKSGAAGENTLECAIGGEDRSFDAPSNGKVTISVEGKGYDYTFTRAASQRIIRVLDRSGAEVEQIAFDEAADVSLVQQFVVEANFHWDLDVRSNWPLWLVNPGITEGVQDSTGLFRNTMSVAVDNALLDGTDKSGSITITDLFDESYSLSVPVSFKAKPVVEVPFFLSTELGTNTLHITPDATFKDSTGAKTAKMYMLGVTLKTLPDEEVVVLSFNGRRFNEECSCFHKPDTPFLSLIQPVQSQDGELLKTEYTLLAQPGIVYPNPSVGDRYDLGYVFVLPKAIWEPYAQYKSNLMMMFIMMNTSNEFFDPYYEPGKDMQASCDDGLVWTVKPDIKKYAIKVTIDSE